MVIAWKIKIVPLFSFSPSPPLFEPEPYMQAFEKRKDYELSSLSLKMIGGRQGQFCHLDN